MRYVCSTAAILVLSILAPSMMFAQNGAAGLSIENYQFVTEQRSTRTKWYVTYRAELVNTGAARPGVVATLSSLVPTVETVPGQTMLHFGPVAAGGKAWSSNTFTILVDRSVAFSFNQLQWSFLNPVAVPGPDQTAPVGTTINLNGSGSTNPSGVGTLSYLWAFVSRPAGSTATLTTPNSVATSFTIDRPGDYIVSLTVNNGVAQDTRTVKISTVNSPPVANAGPNQSVAVGANVNLNGSASFDVDGDPLTYTWTFVSLPANSQAFIGGFRSVTANFTPDLAGTYIIQLVVNDGHVDSAPSTVTITAGAPGNTAPVANAGPDQSGVAIGATVQLNGSGSTDVNGDPLTYQWSLITVPAGSTAVLNNPNAVNPTFVANVAGTYVAQLIVNDGKINSAPDTVTITTAAQAPGVPTANAGPNQTVVHGTLVQLTGAASTDPQNLPLTFAWSLTTRPAGSTAVLSSTNAVNPTFVADRPGNYVAQLIVNNGTLSSAPSTVTITTTNTAPVANAGPDQTVAVGAVVALNGSGSSDADNDPLTFTWSLTTRPNGSNATLSAANSATPTFVADLVGTYVAQLIVNDGFANSAPDTVQITVNGQGAIVVPATLTIGPGNMVLYDIRLAQAPANDVNVELGGFDATKITLSATSLLFRAGSTTPSRDVTITALAVGTTTINATSPGLTPASTAVTVGITATLTPANLIIPGPSPDGSLNIQLSNPAQNNITFNVVSSNPNVATVPSIVPLSAGGTSIGFKVTRAGAGSAVITVSAPGFANMTSNVTVEPPGSISLSISNTNLYLWIPQTLTITLSTPATNGGAVVTLNGNATFLKFSQNPVTIPSGGTQATVQVTGVQVGNPTIGATSPGFTAAVPLQVAVGATIHWVQPTLTVTNYPQDLLLSLGLDALVPGSTAFDPNDGITINLSSTRPDVVTVPSSQTFYWDGSTAPVLRIQAQAVGPGVAIIKASGINIPEVQMTITVTGPLAITTSSLPSGTVGTAYSAPLAATGGVTPYSWAATGLPANLTINPTTGVISGTPQAPGTSTVNVTVQDSSNPKLTGNATFQLQITSTPASIGVQGGSGQSTQVKTAFANTLQAIVRDSNNNPLSGVTVTFTAPAANGSNATGTFAGGLSTVTAVTNAAGIATSPVFTANNKTGTYNVSASVNNGALTTNFSLTNTAGPAASIAVQSGSGQSALINQAFANLLVAIVKDADDNPVPNVSVTYTPPANGANPSGTFAGGVNTATTNASGLATSAVFTANGNAGGPYNVVASVTNNPGLTTNFALTNTQNPPASIAVQSGSGQSAKINTAYTNTLQAIVRDSNNNPVSGVTVTFTPPASNGSNATGTFAGGVNTAVTNASGIATSVVFTANNKVGTYNVAASVSGVAAPANFSLTNTTGDPASIVVSSGSGQSAMINQAFAPLKALVKDAGDNPVPNVSVTFTPPAAGASGTFAGGVNTATTGADGIATAAVFTANGTVGGPYNVAAHVTATPAITVNFSLTNTDNPPASIAVHGGSGQSAKILTAFGNLLQVIVRDAGNNPLNGVTVTFNAPASNGSNATGTFAGGLNTAVTNAQGVATSAVFTANNKVGQYNVTASVNNGALTTSFTLNNTPGDPSTITLQSGGGQSAQINNPFANPFVVLVKDVGDNPVPNVSVTYTPPANGSNPSGSFAGGVNTATTNAQGLATSAAFTANSKVGSYNVAASVTSAPAITTNIALTNTPGPASSIVVSSGTSQSAQTGQPFANALAALVTDTGANPVSGVTVTFTAPASGASGTFANGQITTTAVTNASGIATSSAFTANGTVGGPYQVSATAPGVAGAANFLLTNTTLPAASILPTNGSSPQSAVVMTLYGSVLKALVRDANSNPVSGVTVNFTVPASGPGGTFLGGVNTAVTDASGVASSAPFTANAVAGNFMVQAAVASNPTVFTNFNLTNLPGPASFIQMVSGSNQTANIGANFTSPLVARVTDQFANPIRLVEVTFTAPASGASATFAPNHNSNAVTVITDSAGNATTPTVRANQTVGAYPVTATTPGVVGSAQFNLTNAQDPNAGLIVVSNATIGKDLQDTITINLNPPAPQAGVQLTITVANETMALVGGNAGAQGVKTFQTNLGSGSTSLATIVQALVASGQTTVTVSAPGYNPGTGTITFAPSGFVISSPNGIGAQFNTFLGVTTPLTVFVGRLGGGNVFVQTQQMRGGASANVPVASNVPTVGTVTSASAAFTGGSNSATVNFAASTTNTGSTDIIVTNPAGFTTPATGTSVNAIVGSANMIPFTATVGRNLQKAARISLNAPAAQNVVVTITSSNSDKVKFSTNQNNAGSGSINVSIPQNFALSQEFYVQAFDTVGSPCAGAPPEAPPVCVPYTASAPGFGTVNGEVRLAQSGLLIESPGGFGVGTFSIQQGLSGTLTIYAGVVNNNVVTETQAVAAGLNIPVTVVSSNTNAGTITTSPVTITGGSFSASTSFAAAAVAPAPPNNQSQITASSNGYNGAAVTATVTAGRLLVQSGKVVGNRLQDTSAVFLQNQAAPAGGLTVHLVSNSASLKLATTATGAGQSEIDVFIPAGQTAALFYLHGNADSGTATVTATAPDFASSVGNVTLVASSIIVQPGTASGSVGGSSTVFIFPVAHMDGGFSGQPVAGPTGVTVPINTTNAGVASVPANVNIAAGTDLANLTINFAGAGGATVSVVQPAGFTNPVTLTTVIVNVNP